MHRRLLCLLVAVLASACGTPPEPPMLIPTAMLLREPPIYALFGYRQQLDLTAEQISALDSIAQQLQAENSPLLRELQRNAPPQRAGAEVMAGDSATFEQIRQNRRRAVEGVREVLTEQQQARVCELFRESPGQRQMRAERSPSRRPDARTRRGVPPGEAAGEREVWSWCRSAPGQAETEPARSPSS